MKKREKERTERCKREELKKVGNDFINQDVIRHCPGKSD